MKKSKKKAGKKKGKIPLFFVGTASKDPDDPLQYKTGSKQLDLRPGSPVFAGDDTVWVHRDLPAPGMGKNWA